MGEEKRSEEENSGTEFNTEGTEDAENTEKREKNAEKTGGEMRPPQKAAATGGVCGVRGGLIRCVAGI